MPKKKEVDVPTPRFEKKVQPERHNYVLIVLFVVLVLAVLAFDIALNKARIQEAQACGDGTFYGTCSLTKPYYCDGETGKLVERASVCGCGDSAARQGNSCVFEFQAQPENLILDYVLNGEEGKIDFTTYSGMESYVSGISREIFYRGTEIPQRADFKLKSIDEERQREALLPLVVAIQNVTNDKDDQARIAISLVQSIPYGFSDKKVSFAGSEVNYSRYPYEILADNEGICGEKSALLVFLLREMGYKTAIFYYPEENHEAIGIACPVEHSVDGTGFCFIETSGPAIITDNEIEYVGGITLQSKPQTIPISQGASIGKNWPEYEDAALLKKIRNSYVPFESLRYNRLIEKYGLVEEYNLA